MVFSWFREALWPWSASNTDAGSRVICGGRPVMQPVWADLVLLPGCQKYRSSLVARSTRSAPWMLGIWYLAPTVFRMTLSYSSINHNSLSLSSALIQGLILCVVWYAAVYNIVDSGSFGTCIFYIIKLICPSCKVITYYVEIQYLCNWLVQNKAVLCKNALGGGRRCNLMLDCPLSNSPADRCGFLSRDWG